MNIILVDDEQHVLSSMQKNLSKIELDAVISAFDRSLYALNYAKSNKVDVAFLDINMPEMNGIELAKNLKKTNEKINIIFVTGYSEYALDALEMHASGYITKPISKEKLSYELTNLRNPIENNNKSKNIIKAQCFGNFEVYANGKPLTFSRSKTKELLAYLIDRKGASCSVKELCALLWEDAIKESYLRNLISDLTKALNGVGADNVFVKSFNKCYIVPDKIDCDYYDYEKGEQKAINSYHGEYMTQYSWAEETNASLQLNKN